MASIWPSANTVAVAFKNQLAEIIVTPWGIGKGVRCYTHPHVYLITGPKSLVWCELCKEGERTPDPPGSGGPGESRNPLVAPGTKAHALFVLTWLHRFADAHDHGESGNLSETETVSDPEGETK